MQMTNFLEDYFLNMYIRGVAQTKPTALEVSFHSSSPNEDGTGAELDVFGGGSRLAINFGDAVGRQVANTDAPTDTASGSGTATHWAIHQTNGAGEMLCYQELQNSTVDPTPNPMVYVDGQPVQINIGDMVWTFPDSETTYTDVIVNDFLSHVFGVATGTARSGTHLSLHPSAPNQGTGSPEFSAGGYVRGAVSWNAPSAGANNRQQVTNVAQVDFSNLQASDTPIAYWGVWTADTAGEFLARFDQSDQTINDGDNASAAAGALALLAG